MRDVGELLGAWNGFYVMIGSAAAALTGVMFVVISLVGGDSRAATREGVSIFSTPTIFHFCCVLFTAAVLAAPLHSLVPVAILLALPGAVGGAYVLRIGWRTQQLERYAPDAEDWIWHVVLPLLAYATLIGGALILRADPPQVLYALAAAAVLLIFVGIHNAWDVVTYVAITKAREEPEPEPVREPDAIAVIAER